MIWVISTRRQALLSKLSDVHPTPYIHALCIYWDEHDTVEPVFKDHPIGHKTWSPKTGGPWRQVPLH